MCCEWALCQTPPLLFHRVEIYALELKWQNVKPPITETAHVSALTIYLVQDTTRSLGIPEWCSDLKIAVMFNESQARPIGLEMLFINGIATDSDAKLVFLSRASQCI